MFKLYFCRLSKQSHIVISIFTKQPSTIKKWLNRKQIGMPLWKGGCELQQKDPTFHLAPFEAAML